MFVRIKESFLLNVMTTLYKGEVEVFNNNIHTITSLECEKVEGWNKAKYT